MDELNDFEKAESHNVDPLEEEAKRRGTERAKHLEEGPITQQDAMREMWKHAQESELRYEAFKGERMDDGQFRSLTATIDNALNERKKSLVDIWIMNHPQEVQERTYGTSQLSFRDELNLVREKEGEEFFENDDTFKRLAAVSENLRNSDGQPDLESALVSFSVFEDIQRNLKEDKYKGNLQDPAFIAERRRNLAIQEALYKSVYDKPLAFDEAKSLLGAIADPRTVKDFNEFITSLDGNENYQKKAEMCKNALNPISTRPNVRQVAALESMGYELRFIKKKRFITRGETNKILDVEVYDKEGKQVNLRANDLLDIQRQFVESKQNELAQKYLGEKADAEKLVSLERLALRDPNQLANVSENLRRNTFAKLIERMEIARAKKENPEEAKRYQEALKNKGADVTKMIGDVLEGGEKNKFYKDFKGESDDELKEFFRGYGKPESFVDSLPEFARTNFIDALKKARKGGIMKWVLATINIISQLDKLVDV